MTIQASQSTDKPYGISNGLYQVRFPILMVVLLITILLPGFFEEQTNQKIVWPIIRSFLLLSCLNLIRKMKKAVIMVAVIGLLATSADWLQWIKDVQYAALISFSLFSIFIAIVTYELFNQILKTKMVSAQTIIAAFDGFLLIGIIGFLMFSFIHFAKPNSFNRVSMGEAGINDLLYYSYITLLTIGYGNIVPVSEIAKRLSILVGLVGQFYLVVVMSVLVGKFLSEKKNK